MFFSNHYSLFIKSTRTKSISIYIEKIFHIYSKVFLYIEIEKNKERF